MLSLEISTYHLFIYLTENHFTIKRRKNITWLYGKQSLRIIVTLDTTNSLQGIQKGNYIINHTKKTNNKYISQRKGTIIEEVV